MESAIASAARERAALSPARCRLVLICAAAALSACRVPLHQESRQAMSTVLTVTVAESPRPDWDALFAQARRLGDLLDHRNREGPIGRLNAAGNQRLPAPVLAVMEQAREIAVASGGAFDPTILPLTRLWSFDSGGLLPAPGEIARARKRVDYGRLHLGPEGSVSLPAGFGLDLGGIAKGAVVDGLARYLEGLGYRDFLVDAGGDLLISGLKGDQPWRIGIRHPRDNGRILAVLSLGREKSAVVTSGDYERFFEQAGRKYHHLLDPRTGYPAETLVSVTVIASSCAEADALATAAFILGPGEGLSLLEERAGVEGLLVWLQGEALTAATSGGFPLSPAELHLD